MSWKPLRERLQQLPIVLAGPIIRCSEPEAVTIWLVLKESRTITLNIFDISGNLLLTGSQKTIQIGTHIHLATVTAKASNKRLLNGENYLYNIDLGNGETFDSPNIFTNQFHNSNITYPEYKLPSFALPPNNIDELRLLHGSCRKAHGESIDALATVDKIIGEALSQNPQKRPHQLFLTGDQIYADDVADVLLFMLRDASETLLGWSEVLPDIENIEELNPGRRNHLATNIAGLTASINKINKINNISKSHLFTFSEFLMMYLFVWSDILWVHPEDFPTLEQVHPDTKLSRKAKILFDDEVQELKEFYSTIPQVRRALANIPTYMIFDDHEITDDWNLNLAWCDRIYTKPLGRRIIQNGLLAYALCQGWGNTPTQFISNQPGGKLLQAAETWFLSGGENKSALAAIELHLGIPKVADISQSNPRRLTPNPEALTWHYIITAPSYEVIVLDTRTQREFPGENFDFPALLSQEACEKQITQARHQEGVKITLIISPSPVIGVPFLETIQRYAKSITEKLGTAAWGYDTEAWGLQVAAFERLLATLALRAVPSHQSRVIILSGDVHYSFSSRLQYSATRPFQHQNSISTEMIITQFTSSSFKNEASGFGGSQSLHNMGFFPVESINNLPSSEILGWTNPTEKELEIGLSYTFINDTVQTIPWRIKGNPAMADLVDERGWFRALEVKKKPEWWYRIDFLLAEYEQLQVSQTKHQSTSNLCISPLPGQDRTLALESYLSKAKNHREYCNQWGSGKEIVGVNNIGEITFELTNGREIAVQTLWWRLESWEEGKLLEPFPLTRCEVSLSFNDQKHPMNEILKEVRQD
ncbi:hypothetical protein [Calothrix sp. PCC 6303]|uniref:hypothetical protein n=1 Tax=Calothrix sp. PCC 6303 TaxID=1170562 RepID=UPI0002A017B5|nr:hypothetical protein [Calothrix sp. PCC 6303]AFZ00674.1 hypothetical protein Cal6303_1632 [Calothrix sp. PCC 6303]